MTATVTDLFCGAGGSATGLVEAGLDIVLAANHWKQAIETHALNHPETEHDSADISQVEPRRYPTTDILWASPECTNHSIAKGIKRQRDTQAQLPGLEEPLPDDAAIRSRATMWDVPRFAEYHRYKIVVTENVVDAAKWVMFPAWLQAMELLGYSHEIIWLNSMHAQLGGHGAPQSRDRMYVVFWLKGIQKPDFSRLYPKAFCEDHGLVRSVQFFKKPIEWGRYRTQYQYHCPTCGKVVEPEVLPASTVIDWSNQGQRIGDRKRPLTEKTLLRIQRGIERYWAPIIAHTAGSNYDAADPKHPNFGAADAYYRAFPVSEPLKTVDTWGDSRAVALPPLIGQMRGTTESHLNDSARPVSEPLRGITAGGIHQSLLVPYYGAGEAAPASEPHRTLPTGDRYALAEGSTLDVDDVLFRMLTPDEIKLGMAFPEYYRILGSNREQVKQAGNAVTPPVARDIGAVVLEALEVAA